LPLVDQAAEPAGERLGAPASRDTEHEQYAVLVGDDYLLLLGQPRSDVVALVSHRFQASSCVRRLEATYRWPRETSR
jgi:hypothetical protein